MAVWNILKCSWEYAVVLTVLLDRIKKGVRSPLRRNDFIGISTFWSLQMDCLRSPHYIFFMLFQLRLYWVYFYESEKWFEVKLCIDIRRKKFEIFCAATVFLTIPIAIKTFPTWISICTNVQTYILSVNLRHLRFLGLNYNKAHLCKSKQQERKLFAYTSIENEMQLQFLFKIIILYIYFYFYVYAAHSIELRYYYFF